nr:unnamed protein product [Callosobruchus chinensis]
MQEKYTFFCGTARGNILEVGAGSAIKNAKPSAPSEVTALNFGRSEDEILVGFQNSQVTSYSISEACYKDTLTKLEGEGKVVGLECIKGTLVAAKHDGIINLQKKKNHLLDLSLDDKGTLECMAYNVSRDNVIGTGGEHNDFKLWDVETKQCVFKAKSLGHDKLNLPIPTSVRGITFFPEEPHLAACCTKEGHVLMYDDRAQRKPVVKFFEQKASYASISCAYREQQCFVGTTRGYLQLLDMKSGKCVKTFTSFTGSVTNIVCDPLEPYVCTTSLDRYLRVHNLESKQLVHNIYMKQSLTKLLVRPILKEEKDAEEENENDKQVDEEYDNIFESMEVIGEESKKRKGDNAKKAKKKKRVDL